MLPRWQVEELADRLVANVAMATKVVAELRPREWTQDGAPEVYVEQHQVLMEELEQVRLSAMALKRQPESLVDAVGTFLWLDRTASLIKSVNGGVRRYYNAAVAELLDSLQNRNAESIDLLKAYLAQLAAHIEASMETAHREAQRCRSEIVAEPPA